MGRGYVQLQNMRQFVPALLGTAQARSYRPA
jgi:hypothetical protein